MRAILTYHSIDPSGSPISVAPAEFRAHARWFARSGVRVLSVPDLLAAPAGSEAVAVTFDDGFANVAEHAAPVLAEAGVTATVFVVTDHVGTTNAWSGREAPGIPTLPLLDWPALGRLASAGWRIEAHTRTHPHLPALPREAVEAELDGAAERIARELGVRPAGFAYPYGATSAPVREAVAARYAWAVGTTLAPLDAGAPRDLLPRLDMYYWRTAGALEAWGTPAFARRLRRRQRVRRIGAWVRRLAGRPA